MSTISLTSCQAYARILLPLKENGSDGREKESTRGRVRQTGRAGQDGPALPRRENEVEQKGRASASKEAECSRAVPNRQVGRRSPRAQARGEKAGKPMSRHRGAGSIYKQPGCSTYTIKFYRGGKCVREATGLTDYQAARQKLNQRLNQVAEGTFAGPQMERIRVNELAEDFLRDYRINGR